MLVGAEAPPAFAAARGGPNPVLIVGGTLSPEFALATLALRLRKDGFVVFTTVLGRRGLGDIAASARLVAERVDAILAWSAIPGGSRHHWGSDVDVIDAAAMPDGYQVQLQPAEYAPDGVFARLAAWLDRHMGGFGFFRPYGSDRGGAGIEPWHLSYAPVASPAIESLSLSVLRTAIVHGDMLGKEAVLDRLPEIYTRFILAIDPPAAAGRRETPVRA